MDTKAAEIEKTKAALANPDAPQSVSSQERGETMAYAAQNMLVNSVGNVIESGINFGVQKYFAQHDPAHKMQSGTMAQNLSGEFAGDFAGSIALVAAEALCPEQYHSFSRRVRSWIDPFYEKLARNLLKKDCPDDEYEKKVHDWKVFQERNVVRAGFIGVVGVGANLVAQKVLNNQAPLRVIALGKVISTGIMMAGGLSLRMALPKQMKALDEKMGEIVAPLMKDETSPELVDKPIEKPVEKPAKTSHVEALAAKRGAELETQAAR